MPNRVVDSYPTRRTSDLIGLDGLVEDNGDPTVGPHAQLPRTASVALAAAVVGGGIGRPTEPCGGREVEVCHGDGRSGDRFSTAKESLRTHLPGAVLRCAP